MNFLFVDRIFELQPGKKTVGIKHVTASDVYLTEGRDGRLALCPAIIGETLGQLGAWNVLFSKDFSLRPVAGVVKEVNLFDDAYVGDSIILETNITNLTDEGVHYHSEATVNGKVIFTIKNALGPMLPISQFSDSAEVKQQFEMIYQPGELPTISKSKNNLSQDIKPNIENVSFDHIIDWKKGESVTAQKNISIVASYFVDHFPKKPVFPLTLLIHCSLQLADKFIKESFNERAVVTSLKRIKMNEFVIPGNILESHMTLKEKTETHYRFVFKSTVDGKRVCVLEAEFKREIA